LKHKRLMALGAFAIAALILAFELQSVYSPPTDQSTTASTQSMTTLSTTSTTSNSEAKEVDASTIASNGLRLSTSLNATDLGVGQNLSLIVSIWDTLPTAVTVAPSGNWAFHGLPTEIWPACYYYLPVQVAVLKGNYSAQELPAVTNASTFTSYPCSGGGAQIDSVIFQPMSDEANLTGQLCLAACPAGGIGPYLMSVNFTTSGYWDLQNLSEMSPAFPILGAQNMQPVPSIQFSPGVYTVAVADEWGLSNVLHFTVMG
jgi:hypothetical protein